MSLDPFPIASSVVIPSVIRTFYFCPISCRSLRSSFPCCVTICPTGGRKVRRTHLQIPSAVLRWPLNTSASSWETFSRSSTATWALMTLPGWRGLQVSARLKAVGERINMIWKGFRLVRLCFFKLIASQEYIYIALGGEFCLIFPNRGRNYPPLFWKGELNLRSNFSILIKTYY